MTYQELLRMIDDLKRLSVPPQEEERSGCMSSRDRSSRYEECSDTYVQWSANQDDKGFIREAADGAIVAFECDGPGVIWRSWSALPQSGPMQVYIDGGERPVIDVPFRQWFEWEPGMVPPMNFTQLALRQSRGFVSYIPIPFQKKCRIELLPEWGRFYHFTYSLFPKQTVMPKYEERYGREGRIALAELDRRLYGREGRTLEGGKIVRARIAPHEEAVLAQERNGGAIRELRFYPDELADRDATLQRLILKIWWDEDPQPSVDAPLGDFFGSAPGFHPHSSLPLSMEKRQYTCRWYMPYRSGMRMTLENRSEREQNVAFEWLEDHDAHLSGERLRFHAKWHTGLPDAQDPVFMPGGMRWPDWPILKLHGVKGRFCGMHLHVVNCWREPDVPAETWWYGNWGRKSIDWWWGEGDEKFFVDGEKFPSTFGTGSEDYIGYAWAAEPPFAQFSEAFAAMSHVPLSGNGHTSVARYQIADHIPFQHSFEAYLEKYRGEDEGGNSCLYAVVPFWYQEANTADGCQASAVEPFLGRCEEVERRCGRRER